VSDAPRGMVTGYWVVYLSQSAARCLGLLEFFLVCLALGVRVGEKGQLSGLPCVGCECHVVLLNLGASLDFSAFRG